ncbi:SAM-dependent methyltransferase [Sphingobium sufflavum]|uniref:class I SAM-dependent methyltransferase n=1 Tax=Sphingobium sufflavum TaxID=1129547 RepID=UPI001F2DE0AD|nr:SAM-dependent methyltransferase [Sphingobium sufflavum]MCE7795192.1 SAM-dependent methyltransferase [Sphingobium sufflavum]
MTLHDYMALANAHYYATRDPLGAGGDFITAPEISQMFGEMIGLWLADLWARAGRPAVQYVELGPGRGTLAADALRALASAGCHPLAVHLVETSPVLRAAQARAVPDAHFHDDAATLPTDTPLLIVANEFFDALPFRQIVRTDAGWRERVLANDRLEWGRRFLPGLGTADVTAPAAFAPAPQGSVVESCPIGEAIMTTLATRIAAQGGAMLTIDYGHAGPAVGDTMQAVQAHRFADPFVEPGARDITAHVDFTALADAAVAAGVNVSPLVEQGDFLIRLGIGARSGMLAKQAPERRDELVAAMLRLTDPAEMGRLFKVMAAVDPDWPVPEGFA